MKKYFLLVSLFVATACRAVTGWEPLSQWMLFNGDYAYLDNQVKKAVNFGGGQNVVGVVTLSDGTTVFAVAGKGLFKFDGKKMTEIRAEKSSFPAQADITALACDSKNTLWIGTTMGLTKYDGSAFTDIPFSTSKIQVVTDIAITATDKVYISGYVPGDKVYAGGGVSFYNGATWINYSKPTSDIPDNVMSDLLLDENGFLWGIPGNHDMGVAKFDGKVWKHYTNGNGLPTNMVSCITTNASGRIWLGSPKGIMKFEKDVWTMTPFSNGYSPKVAEYAAKSNDGLDVTTLTMEEDGTVWVGTRSNGVLCMANGGLRVLNNGNSPLSTNAVLKISIDKNGYKWITGGYRNPEYAKYAMLDGQNRTHTMFTMYGGGVAAYREHAKVTDGKWLVYTSSNSTIELGQSMSIDEDRWGAIWFPNTLDGLVRYKDGIFTMTKHDKAMQSAFTKMYMAPDGKIYLTATVGGIKVFNNNKIEDYAKNPNMGGASGGMTYDKNNVLWAAGTGGVSKFANNEWENYNKKDGLPSIIVYSIMKDSKGTLWAGTGKGLAKWDTSWVEVGADVDFPSNDFTAMTEDSKGNLWLGSKKGISIYDGKTFNNLAGAEALDLKRFYVNCISIDKNGVAWIGTESDGILRYDGTNWTQYAKKNTGGLFDKVTAIKAGSDGKVYAISEPSMMNDHEFNMPNQAPEEMMRQEIAKKVRLADPKRVLLVLRP